MQQKNEPNPKGGSTPKGSLSISAKLKAEGNPGVLRRFTSYGGPAGAIFFCFISWHISCLCCFSPLVVYVGTLPQSLIAKTRPVLTIFRKLGKNHSAFFVSTSLIYLYTTLFKNSPSGGAVVPALFLSQADIISSISSTPIRL